MGTGAQRARVRTEEWGWGMGAEKEKSVIETERGRQMEEGWIRMRDRKSGSVFWQTATRGRQPSSTRTQTSTTHSQCDIMASIHIKTKCLAPNVVKGGAGPRCVHVPQCSDRLGWCQSMTNCGYPQTRIMTLGCVAAGCCIQSCLWSGKNDFLTAGKSKYCPGNPGERSRMDMETTRGMGKKWTGRYGVREETRYKTVELREI